MAEAIHMTYRYQYAIVEQPLWPINPKQKHTILKKVTMGADMRQGSQTIHS